jgi:hypothetical protein
MRPKRRTPFLPWRCAPQGMPHSSWSAWRKLACCPTRCWSAARGRRSWACHRQRSSASTACMRICWQHWTRCAEIHGCHCRPLVEVQAAVDTGDPWNHHVLAFATTMLHLRDATYQALADESAAALKQLQADMALLPFRPRKRPARPCLAGGMTGGGVLHDSDSPLHYDAGLTFQGDTAEIRCRGAAAHRSAVADWRLCRSQHLRDPAGVRAGAPRPAAIPATLTG